MDKQKTESTVFDSSNLFDSLYKWRKHLLIIAGSTLVASFIFTLPFFITPKYKSTVIMFPTSTNSISKALLSDNPGSQQDILEFGEEEQAEQLLQILNSNEIRSKIIKKYDLINHYGISTSSNYVMTKLYDEYENNITYKRTEFMAVEIEVMDKDPQIAANIANDIAALLDSTKNKMKKERALKGFRIVENEYKLTKERMNHMEDSLVILRKKGILDYETQTEMITEQMAYAIAHNNASGAQALQSKLDTIAKYGGLYVSLRDALEYEKKQFSVLQGKYQEAKVDAEQDLPAKFIVNSAYKAEKKSYPVRWLIMLISTFSTVLLGWIVILIIENFHFKKKLELTASMKQ
jgi:uncharacterized protein involved in exopolysaccharide biosynthesis